MAPASIPKDPGIEKGFFGSVSLPFVLRKSAVREQEGVNGEEKKKRLVTIVLCYSVIESARTRDTDVLLSRVFTARLCLNSGAHHHPENRTLRKRRQGLDGIHSEIAVGPSCTCLPDPRTCPLHPAPYLGEAPDAVQRPARQAHRLVRPRASRRALGAADTEGRIIDNAEIVTVSS